MAGPCFHCGEPLSGREPWTVRLEGEERPVCCPGCQAVAELIRDSGLADFYRYRTAPGSRPGGDPAQAPDDDAPWRAFDRPGMLDAVSAPAGDGTRACTLLVEGVRCAACGWLIEKRLEHLPGVREVRVNPATARARLVWDPSILPLSRALGALAGLGYRPHPGDTAPADLALRERRGALRRLGVAGLGMMQAMMYAVALYAGAFQGMDAGIEQLLRWVSLLVATPVALYSGWPFFAGAWRDLRAGRPGMDVPVALAVGGAWAASVLHTVTGTGEVYFDSVSMFVFLLSLGRFLEMGARHRTGSTRDALARLLPQSARRRGAGGEWESVALPELAAGDRVQVRHGEALPADGRLASAAARLGEALLTGESRPRARVAGEPVLAGSLNLGDPLELEVERTGADTRVSAIGRLLDQAQSERPPLAAAADRAARWFVLGVLAAAACTWFAWHALDPARAFEITLAVLVVTCPCALSLATPAAMTAAIGHLARRGLLVARAGAVERLAHATRIVFDKTGTLTRGQPRLTAVEPAPGVDPEQAVAVAAALESASEHPLARAFAGLAAAGTPEHVVVHPGLGIEGTVGGRRYRLGRPDFAGDPLDEHAGGTRVALSNEDGVLARFVIADALRPEVPREVRRLGALGLPAAIASGDATDAVAPIAAAAGVADWHAGLAPEDKLARLRTLQAAGERVVMVGDGVNDAPVLAGADVSVAMAAGTPLAHTSADMVLLGESLAPLADGVAAARRALAVTRQNLYWAAGYNLVALPLAATGWVAPWMAAIGMSASSLLVVLNALRLGRAPRRAPAPAAVLAQEAGA